MAIKATVGKIALRILAGLFALILVIALLLQLPPVQTWVAQKATQYISKKTNSEISIGKIRIALFEGAVEIKDLFVEDQQQDTLASVGSLTVGVQVSGLLSKKLLFDNLQLKNAIAKMYPVRDTVMNYQFLIDAFSSDAPPDTSASAWEIGAHNAAIGLESVRFFMEMPDSTIIVDTQVGSLDGFVRSADLASMAYDITNFALRHTSIDLVVGGEEESEDTTLPEETAPENTEAPAGQMHISLGAAELEDIAFTMASDGLNLRSTVPIAKGSNLSLAMVADSMGIGVPAFQLTDGSFSYDLTEQPELEGIDYSHLALDSIQIDLESLLYSNLDIEGELNQLAAREKSGMALTSLQGNFHYNPDSIQLESFKAATYHSGLDVPKAKITLPFSQEGGTIEDMFMDMDIAEAIISPVDISMLAPTLAETGYLDVPANDNLILKTRFQGDLRQLAVASFDLEGWGLQVEASGSLGNVTDTDNLNVGLDISPISVNIPVLKRHLPDSLLPDSLNLPTTMLADANLQGSMDSLHIVLNVRTGRPGTPISAVLGMEGYVNHAMDSIGRHYHVRVDSLLVSREEMMAYLPASMADSIHLPDAFELKAELDGSMDSVSASYLDLQEDRDSVGIRLLAHGKVAFPTETRAMQMDVTVDTLYAPASSIAVWMPDSILPEGIIIPDIDLLRGFARGSMDSLQAEIDSDLAGGTLLANVILEDSIYTASLELDSLQLVNWMDSLYYDSIVGISLLPLYLDLELHGKGFDPRNDLTTDLRLKLLPIDTAGRFEEGLQLTASSHNMAATLSAQVKERGLVARLSGNVDFNENSDSLAQIAFNLDQLNLQELRLSKKPVYARGAVTLESNGLSLSDLDASVGLKSLTLVFDTVRVDMDSLMLDASLHDRQNKIDLRSDIGTGNLEGNFDYPDIFTSMGNHIKSYFIPLGPRDSIFTGKQDSIHFLLNVTDPTLLTTGIIPGLTELAPIQLEGTYSPEMGVLAIGASIPHIKYKSFGIENFLAVAGANQDSLGYSFRFSGMEGPAGFEARNFSIEGVVDESNRFINHLSQVDDEGNPHYDIQAVLDREDGVSHVTFRPDLLIDDTTWTLPETNRIEISQGEIEVSDWDLSLGDQHITLDAPGSTGIQLNFDRFDMDLISELLKDGSDLIGGIANGNISVENILENPEVTVDLKVDEFSTQDASLGDLSINVNQEDSTAWKAALNLQGGSSNFTLDGFFRPRDPDNTLDFTINADPLDLEPFAPLSFGNLKKTEGRLFANLRISGSISDPLVDGQIRFDGATLTPALLGAPIELGGSPITFQASTAQGTNVNVSNLTLTDDQGQVAQISGNVVSSDLVNHIFNLQVKGENFHIMNTTAEDNELYYGDLNLDFDGKITGPLDSLDMTIQAQPTNESKITYTFPVDAVEENENWDGIITFDIQEPVDSSLAFLPNMEDSVVQVRSGGMNLFMTLNLTLDDNLELTIITDPIAGDNFKGKAEGNLSLQYGGPENIQLGGQITIEEGLYNFTYTEFVKREFEVLPGSTITWTRDPADPKLEVSAQYVSRASPRTLVEKYIGEPTTQVSEQLRRRQDFNVVFKISGELDDMSIETTIEYAKTSFNSNIGEINSAIATLNQDESETNSQAFSLLLFNSFLASSNAAGGKLINLSQSFSDVITGYLNNVADQYIGFVEIDFDIESSGDNFNSYFEDTDFRVSLKKRFLDDRLEISVDGVASSNDPNSSAQGDRDDMQAYLDNINVEYSITPGGVLKVRVFNQRDTEDFLGGDVIKLGGALVFSKSFKKLRLFGPKSKRNDSEPPPPDQSPEN